jgi:hypothetical protein
MKAVKGVSDLKAVFGDYFWSDKAADVRGLLNGKLCPDALELSYCNCGAESIEDCECETTYDCYASREEKVLHHLVCFCDTYVTSLHTLGGKEILHAYRDDYGAKTLALVDGKFVIASPFDLERLV